MKTKENKTKVKGKVSKRKLVLELSKEVNKKATERMFKNLIFGK